jgi:hypothetical protein
VDGEAEGEGGDAVAVHDRLVRSTDDGALATFVGSPELSNAVLLVLMLST